MQLKLSFSDFIVSTKYMKIFIHHTVEIWKPANNETLILANIFTLNCCYAYSQSLIRMVFYKIYHDYSMQREDRFEAILEL